MTFAACFGLLALWSAEPNSVSPQQACGLALAQNRAWLERIKPEARIGPTLALIGERCAALDPQLAKNAKEAAGLPRVDRVEVLARDLECKVKVPSAAAESVVLACPPGERDPQGAILRLLDAGTYAFIRQLQAKLVKAGTSTHAELVLSELARISAMEAEAGPKHPTPRR
jgi:hypothetical protein